MSADQIISFQISRPPKDKDQLGPSSSWPQKTLHHHPCPRLPFLISSFSPFRTGFPIPPISNPSSFSLASSLDQTPITGPHYWANAATHPCDLDAPPMLRCAIHASKHHPCLTRASSSSARSTWPSWPPPASPPAPAPEGKPAPPRPWADSARRQCRRSARIP